MSIGDYNVLSTFEFFDAKHLAAAWIWWFITMIIACVVFLNFIVAEASNSYNNVSANLEEFKCKCICEMIIDSETLIPNI